VRAIFTKNAFQLFSRGEQASAILLTNAVVTTFVYSGRKQVTERRLSSPYVEFIAAKIIRSPLRTGCPLTWCVF